MLTDYKFHLQQTEKNVSVMYIIFVHFSGDESRYST